MQQITQISTEVLRVHPRNQEFFDDIEGKAYEQFKESIKNEGVVTPLIVAPDMTIVSGHQRLKACEDLGIKKIPVIIREDLDDEDEKLKKLLATNFGRTKNDPAKQVKVASEYVGLVGMKQGRPNKTCETRNFTQDEIASQLGVSVRTLNELLEIDRKLIPQIRELFDDGKITKYTANKVWCRLSPEDQEKFFNEIGRDKISQMTQVQTQKYIDDLKRVEVENQQLQSELQREKCKPTRIEYKERVVDKTDYSLKSKVEEYKNRITSMVDQLETMKNNKAISDAVIEDYQKELEEYKQFKNRLIGMQSIKGGDYDEVDVLSKIDELYLNIDMLIKTSLSPVRYSEYMRFINKSPYITDSFITLLDTVQQWCDDMRSELNQNNNIINVEGI